MQKVLIIDDRTERKKLHLSASAQQALEKLVHDGCLTITDSIYSLEELESYSLVAVHRSYLVNIGQYNSFLDYCRKNHILFVVFSGNISQNAIMNSGQQLNINASDFYSEKLPTFILEYCNDAYKYPLLQYLYGASWKLSLLLQYRYLLWTYDDVDEIDDDADESLEERIRSILWGGEFVNKNQVNMEIEVEKTKIHHS